MTMHIQGQKKELMMAIKSVSFDLDDTLNIDYISIQNEPNWEPEYASCVMAPSEAFQGSSPARAGYSEAFDAVYVMKHFRTTLQRSWAFGTKAF